MKNNFPEIEIDGAMIRQRSKHNKAFTLTSLGHLSLLLSVEPTIINAIIQLSRIRQIINTSHGLLLENSIIDGTPAQADLVEWKLNIGYYGNNIGKLGTGYWREFREKNNKFVSRNGLKFEIDRASWLTYANINQTYNIFMVEFMDANFSGKRDKQMYMDRREYC